MIAQLATLLADRTPSKRISMMFVDSAFGAAIVERLHVLGHQNVQEVNFGSVKTPDPHYHNMRSYMWGKQMKDWLGRGCIDKSDTKLAIDLMAPGWHLNNRDQLLLESKADMMKRGQPSPDDGDALALTFAQTVAPEIKPQGQPKKSGGMYAWAG